MSRLGRLGRREAEHAALDRRDVRIGAVTLSHGRAGAGPPVVLIHGLGGSGRWWAKNVGPLAERFEVHVVDLAGFGESRRRQRFALAEAAGHLAALLDRLGIGPTAIVGHSMGGYIAAELAVDVPELVSRLVLVDAAMLAAGFLSPRQVLNLALAMPRLPARFLPTLASDVGRAGPATMVRATRELLAADLGPKLDRIQAQTLVVWGDRDRVTPLAAGRALAARLSNAELVVIPGAGHLPMWERPEAFNRVVLDFLEAASDGTSPPRVGSREDEAGVVPGSAAGDDEAEGGGEAVEEGGAGDGADLAGAEEAG